MHVSTLIFLELTRRFDGVLYNLRLLVAFKSGGAYMLSWLDLC